VKLLATSDLHLGRHSSLPFEESEADLTASAHTWHRIVDLAIREDVDAVLLAGDLVDQANRFYEAASTLEKGIRRMVDARIPVVMVSGNHDHEVLPEVVRRLTVDSAGNGPGSIAGSDDATADTAAGSLAGTRAEPDGDPGSASLVHLLGRNGRWETRTITVRSGEQLQVTGWSFPEQQSRYSRNPMDSFEPPPQTGLLSVGLLHCDVNQPDSVYAPVAADDFNGTGLDYWVLGHIHKKIKWRESAPEVFYPGAPHPFDAGERDAGSVYIIDTAGSSSQVPVAPVRYLTLRYEVTDMPDSQLRGDFLDRLRETAADPEVRNDVMRLLVLTVLCRGTASNIKLFMDLQDDHHGEMISVGEDLRAVVRKWVEEPVVETDLEKLAENSNPAGLLASWILHLDRKRAAGSGEEYPDELRRLLDACREEYRTLAAHSVFKPVVDGGQVPPEPDDDMIETLFRSRAMTLLQTLITQAEDRK
jgi:DNA repair protein SbcD/Mre11